MKITFLVVTVLCALPMAAWGQVLFTEDFESGLGAWTAMVKPLPTNNNTPVVFEADGVGIYGNNTGYPGSRAVGFSSNLAEFDGQQPQWLQLQWPALLPAGTYDVVISVDRYAYFDSDGDGPGDEDSYGLGDRIYVLTESKYNQPFWNYDGSTAPDGTRWSNWSNKGTGVWLIGAVLRGQSIQTTAGNVELRLLMHEKAKGQNTVAWDNLTLTLRQTGGGPIVFTYPSGTAGTLSTRTDDDTGVVTLSSGHGLQVNDKVTVAWPASPGGIRSLMTVTDVTGDDVTIDLGTGDVLPAQAAAVTVIKPEDFEDGLAGWTTMLYGGGANNDTPQTFTSTDPALYWNKGNPGSTSAGYSSNMSPMDFTNTVWLQRQFTISPGSYEVVYEYDTYVYKYPSPNNDQFQVFPGPTGTGIYGPNTNYPGSQSVGTSYSPTAHDGTRYVYLQKLYPAAVAPGTYAITLDADVYVYLQNSTGSNQAGARILVLADGNYSNPGTDPNGGETTTLQRVSAWNQSSAGTWVHVNNTAKSITTTTGNIEFRLVSDDQMQVTPGPLTVAFDNVSFILTPSGGGDPALSSSDDFESGYGDWRLNYYYGGDPWGVGNRMCVLTDDLFNQPSWNADSGTVTDGFRNDYWPGEPWVNNIATWANNGLWRHVVHTAPLATDTGNIEVRLLLYDKNSGAQAIAWDNLSLTLSSPSGACCLPDATCVTTDQDDCEANLDGRYQGAFTACDDPGLLCCPDPFADTDTDGDVDQMDFAFLQRCLTSTDESVPAGCECVDVLSDGDISSADLAVFENCASGPGVQASRFCDDQR